MKISTGGNQIVVVPVTYVCVEVMVSAVWYRVTNLGTGTATITCKSASKAKKKYIVRGYVFVRGVVCIERSRWSAIMVCKKVYYTKVGANK